LDSLLFSTLIEAEMAVGPRGIAISDVERTVGDRVARRELRTKVAANAGDVVA
jgi:hypothetical protein